MTEFINSKDISDAYKGVVWIPTFNKNDLNNAFADEISKIGFGVYGEQIKDAFFPVITRLIMAKSQDLSSRGLSEILNTMHSPNPLIRDFVKQFVLNYGFVHSICTGDLEQIEVALKLGANPDAQLLWRGVRRTALADAAMIGNKAAVNLILRYGGNPNISRANSETPLALAANKGYIEICEVLLNAGADPNIVTYGGTALALADNLDTVKFLVEHGADVNIPDRDGDLPIIGFMTIRDHASVRYLLEAGTDVKRENKHGMSVIDYAKQLGDQIIMLDVAIRVNEDRLREP